MTSINLFDDHLDNINPNPELDAHIVNVVLQAVQNHQPDVRYQVLTPSLTYDKVNYFIEETLDMPDGGVFLAATHGDYHFYYCRHNGQVYQAILTGDTVLHVYRPQLLR